MKKQIITVLLVLSTINFINAQSSRFYGADIYKYYNSNNYGSARVQGMGVSTTALGGDMSNTFINPAGLGFYNRNEFSFTPLITNQKSNSEYLNNKTSTSGSNMNLGHIGAVFSKAGDGTRKLRSSWGISYNTLTNFNTEYTYQGTNKMSSIADHYTENANSFKDTPGLYEDAENFDAKTGTSKYTEGSYYWAHLIEPNFDAQNKFQNFYSGEGAYADQFGRVRESGALSQVNLSFGSNYDNKTYIGGSIGIQNLNYSQKLDHSEKYIGGVWIDKFTHTDELFVKGSGVNFLVGGIFKVSDNFNVGATFQTPTWMGINETLYNTLAATAVPNTIKLDYNVLETSPQDLGYRITSPLKANIAGSYFLPKKIGVINIEAEYVKYSGMNVRDTKTNINNGDEYIGNQKSEIQSTFKDVLNIKAGGELRLKMLRLRAGINYLPSPIKLDNSYLSNDQLVTSFGLGIKNSKYFADISYRYNNKITSAFTPYTLEDPTQYASASINKSTGVLGFTLGTYF